MGCIKVLLVGNSYTYYNGCGEMLSRFCKLAGKDVVVVRATKGGVSADKLITDVLEYKAWKDGKVIDSGKATLSNVVKRDFNALKRAGEWDFIFLQNNATVKATESLDIKAFEKLKSAIKSPKNFIINCTHFGNSIKTDRLVKHQAAQKECKCSLIDTRGLFASYSKVFQGHSWLSDLTIGDKPNYHASARGMYIDALAMFVKLFGASWVKNCKLTLCHPEEKTASEFIKDKYHKGTKNGNTITKTVSENLQTLVYKYADVFIGSKLYAEPVQQTQQSQTDGGVNTLKAKYSGVDISKYNPTVDYAKLAKATDFVIIRVGFRGYSAGKIQEDTKFTTHIKNAISKKIPVGVYFYSQAITPAEARAEAQYVLKKIKGYNITLPVYFDTEYAEKTIPGKGTVPTGRLYDAHLTKSAHTKVCLAFCEAITKAGYKAGVYANVDFFTNKLDAKQLDKYSIWCAYYSKTNPQTKIKNATIDIWQYGKSGKVSGISGKVDVNYMFTDLIKKPVIVKPVTPVKPKPKVKYYPRYTGTSSSISDALASLHYDSSFSHRKKIAKANNIKSYVGRPKQNIKMLNLLKEGKLIKE